MISAQNNAYYKLTETAGLNALDMQEQLLTLMISWFAKLPDRSDY